MNYYIKENGRLTFVNHQLCILKIQISNSYGQKRAKNVAIGLFKYKLCFDD